MNNEKIGKLIKNARLSKGYTQKDLADKLGVTDKAVSKWECGKSFPDVTMIGSISRELEISVDKLVGIADESKEDAIMLEKIEKKIKIRMAIFIVVFGLLAIRFLTRVLCDFTTYSLVMTIVGNIFFFIYIAVGIISLISAITLIVNKRRLCEPDEEI